MPSYAEEQETLQEGTGEDGLETLPEVHDPEVNPVLYRDVESLLFRGFVVAHGAINDVRVVWKSLSHQEYDVLTLAYGEDVNNAEFQVAFFSASVFLFNGINTLGSKEDLAPLFLDMTSNVRRVILKNLHEVNRRSSVATQLVEAYAMERRSRVRWGQLRGLPLTSSMVTGIAGTDQLGHNWAQLIWRSLNDFEDQVETADREWDNAKFIGSCFTKLTKVYNQDQRRKRQNKIDRADRKREILDRVIMLAPEGEIVKSGGARLEVARSEAELVKQVAKSLRGEKDLHDQIVEQTERRIQEMHRLRDEERERLQALQEEAFEGRLITGGSDFTPLTLEQARAAHNRTVLDTRRQLEALPAHHLDEQSQERAQKWMPGLSPALVVPPPPALSAPPVVRNVPVTPLKRRG